MLWSLGVDTLTLARTVADMIGVGLAAIIGISVGLLVVFGPLSALAAPANNLNQLIVEWCQQATNFLVGLGGASAEEHPVGRVLQVVLSTAMPGIAAVALVVAGKGASNIRRMFSAVLMVAAFSSFIFLPLGQAFLLCIFALVASSILSLASGVLLTVPLVALATILGASYGLSMYAGDIPAISRGAIELAGFTDGEGLYMWKAVLMFVGVAPFAFAASQALGINEKKKKKDSD